MDTTQKIFERFSEETVQQINKIFGNTDKFYAIVYLIARNAHQCELDADPTAKQRLQTIRVYQGIIRFMLDESGINGEEVMDAISSDYLVDYVNYKERDFGLTDEEFVAALKQVIVL